VLTNKQEVRIRIQIPKAAGCMTLFEPDVSSGVIMLSSTEVWNAYFPTRLRSYTGCRCGVSTRASRMCGTTIDTVLAQGRSPICPFREFQTLVGSFGNRRRHPPKPPVPSTLCFKKQTMKTLVCYISQRLTMSLSLPAKASAFSQTRRNSCALAEMSCQARRAGDRLET
jgi:hypothetical protein